MELEARKAAFSQDSAIIASAVAKKVMNVLQASPNIKEKGPSGNPTLGLVLMVLQGRHLSLASSPGRENLSRMKADLAEEFF